MPSEPSAESSPNLLFVICDDLNTAVEGFGGHPQTRTPNISRLADQSVTFENAHCNAPICAPSRASLWSGLLPHTSGDFDFGHWQEYPLLQETVMLQEQFGANGYDVYGTGKLFHNGQEPYEFYDEFGWETSFGPFPSDGDSRAFNPHPRQQSLYEDSDIRFPWEQTFGPLSSVPGRDSDDHPGSAAEDGWFLYDEPFRYESETERDRMPDERSAEWAAERLRASHEDPFAMFVGFNRPHTPLYAPKAYFEKFPLEELELPDREPTLPDGAPEITEDLYGYAQDRFDLLEDAGGEELRRQWLQAYLACVNFVDDQLGTVLDALEAGPNADDTVIVFTSDNGFHMGEKGLLFKKTLYEEATQVPLLISTPDERRTTTDRCSQPVSLVDLYPTLNELCDLPPAPNAGGTDYALDGTSLCPLVENPDAESHGSAYALSAIDGAGEDVERGWFVPVETTSQAHFSIRGERYRFTRFSDGDRELYDHESDPDERDNLVGASTHAAAEETLQRDLLQLLQHRR